jgi:hypothetical protein
MTRRTIDSELEKLIPIAEAYNLKLNRLFDLRKCISIYYRIQNEFTLLIIELDLFLEEDV